MIVDMGEEEVYIELFKIVCILLCSLNTYCYFRLRIQKYCAKLLEIVNVNRSRLLTWDTRRCTDSSFKQIRWPLSQRRLAIGETRAGDARYILHLLNSSQNNIIGLVRSLSFDLGKNGRVHVYL